MNADPFDGARAHCARALTELGDPGRHGAGDAAIAAVTVRAPAAPLETFLRASPRPMSLLWHEPGGPAFAASGVAARIDVAGEDRCERLGRETERLFATLRHLSAPGAEGAPRPRVFGGLSFLPSASHPAPWDEFGDGSFTLPRWTYARTGDAAFLTLAIPVGDAKNPALDELDAIFAALARGAAGDAAGGPPLIAGAVPELRQQSADVWRRHIDAVRAAIGSGAFEKIVAARRGEAVFDRPIDDLEVLARLAQQPGCTRFAFRRDRTTFLGATPETLFEKRGLDLTTEALAGTIRSSAADADPGAAARHLLSSRKDLDEHAFVVREIRRSLAPLTVDVTNEGGPVVRHVRDIAHLHTPIAARLRESTRAADLVAALHPTPAVGGAPTREAARWIVDHEPDHRGWYTGTIGWLDDAGDARFAVAIRAGVVSGDRAYLFTGAGIVKDSDADAEYAETALKQRPLLRALGMGSDP